MTEPKRYQKGKHSYVKWGPNFKQVRVQGSQQKSEPTKNSPSSVEIQIDDKTTEGVYSNLALLHRSEEEAVIDFGFVPPGYSKAKIMSRVVVPLKAVPHLAQLFQNAANEIQAQDQA